MNQKASNKQRLSQLLDLGFPLRVIRTGHLRKIQTANKQKQQEDTNSKQTKTITYLERLSRFLQGNSWSIYPCKHTLRWCCNPLKTVSSS